MANTKNKASGNSGASLKKAVDTIFAFLYHMRKIVLAVPVVYFTIRLAAYNMSHLPTEVGIFLQTNGDFLYMMDRNTMVIGPMFLTLGCLCLMFFSHKVIYAWAVSVFTLALPLLIWFSNCYPA